MTRVLVTGASGFLALHVVKQLLESGQQYIVRGTVRSFSERTEAQTIEGTVPRKFETTAGIGGSRS